MLYAGSFEAFIEMGEGAWPWYSDCDLFDQGP